MRDLNYQLKRLCFHNRDGSYSTQANREKILNLIANQLQELGYRRMGLRSLKPKHVDALVKRWGAEDLAVGTIKNRMNCLRWWAAKVNRSNVVARSNEFYGIPDRNLVSQLSKAQELSQESLSKIKDPYVKASLELQRAFGLRREEAIKFMPGFADKGDHLCLKASWTKGGRPREVPIRTRHQREVLDRVHELAKSGALIPATKNYIQQLRVYERQTSMAGLSKLHGLRHAYAQERYRELTGWNAPANGGPAAVHMDAEQKEKDHQARLTISRELGHSREQISVIYLSR
ncbi:integrase [Aestuariicella hydrocarbonica]|uniref:Integrase n=1 Tax=Pseudomaricurvus hydrocarbonicus TaxID=1470433 RepID=A0A9E5MNT4_9GAMM|nr:phage integrase N-terminal domain-containing protein [Aestuariicella hydrocarbonica]NHO67693.1 integrase [Aestuariicella hydrocarbonica]